ncbi:MAG: ankyrin repeat domain-containing protein [Tatlockia sp.]|nr:ankyrin repeat domain-containing protein [Tatlockia sp.]
MQAKISLNDNPNDVESLLTYVEEGNTKAIDQFLLEDKNWLYLPLENERGKSLIHFAVISGKITLLEHLLRIDPQLINHKDQVHRTPLHFAASQGCSELVIFLLKAKANQDIKAKIQQGAEKDTTALGYASAEGHQGCMLLLAKQKMLDSLDHKNPINVNELIDYFISANFLNLEWKQELVHLIIQKGSELSLFYLFNKTNCYDVIQAKLSYGTNCLHLAAQHGNVQILEYLLKLNQVPKLKLGLSIEGEISPMDVARYHNQDACIKLLQPYYLQQFKLSKTSYDMNDLISAVGSGYSGVVDYLIEQGLSLNIDLMHFAINKGHLDLVKNFISRDSSFLNPPHDLTDKFSIIEIAALAKKENLVLFLIEQVHEASFNPELYINREQFNSLKKRVDDDAIISLLIFALEAHNKAAIPDLVDNAEQVFELLNLDPSLSYIFSENLQITNILNSADVGSICEKNKDFISRHLYKPAKDKRKSMYLHMQTERKTNKITLDLFKPAELLGSSAKCIVREFKTEDQRPIAVKSYKENRKINTNEKNVHRNIEREIMLTQKANYQDGEHRGFLWVRGEGYNFRFIKPSYTGVHADLALLKIINLNELALLILSIVQTLLEKHEKNIVHGDLKANNIVINAEDGVVKIIDYGHASEINQIRSKISNLNMLYYSWYAPETRGEGQFLAHPSQDVYSLAIMLSNILAKHPVKEPLFQCYASIAKFIERGLANDPGERPALIDFFTELCQELSLDLGFHGGLFNI